MEHLQYPVGKFHFDESIASASIEKYIHTIAHFPETLREALDGMTLEQLETPYRPGGWNARQVIHHVADSHSHALIRFKWVLTEESPTIKPYLEDKYATLQDYDLPVDTAISILNGVHKKWSYIMQNLDEKEWQKGYFHPETKRFFTLINAAALYDWHCRHHLGHINICKNY